MVVDTNDWGTTEFVDHLDMPASEGAVVLSSRLFPPTQVNIAVAPFQSELSDHDLPLQSETEDEREPLPTFRMSCKQDLNGGGGSQSSRNGPRGSAASISASQSANAPLSSASLSG